MNVYRVFDWDGTSTGEMFGGPLYVPAQVQGRGRFDIPFLDGVLYCALSDMCAVVEAIQMFRGSVLAPGDFRRPGGRFRQALTGLVIEDLTLPDLSNPTTLSAHGWTTAQVTSMDRPMTQGMAATLYQEGVPGFLWPSAIESECRNATLFASRVRGSIKVAGKPVDLDTNLPVVQHAAGLLRIPQVIA